jgi:hypothetical protein
MKVIAGIGILILVIAGFITAIDDYEKSDEYYDE